MGRPYYEAKGAFEKSEKDWGHPLRRKLQRHAPLTAMFYPEYSNYSLQFAYFEARRDLGKVATALKLYKLKYGSYPKHLTDLVPNFIHELPRDPFTGSDLLYHKEGKGFLLYSLGQNGKDDGGKVVTKKGHIALKDKYLDIPWRQSF